MRKIFDVYDGELSVILKLRGERIRPTLKNSLKGV
jgi:hypothetical protein